ALRKLVEISQPIYCDGAIPIYGCTSWLHFDKPKEEEIRFLQETLKIHDLTVEDIVHQNQRPKLDSFDNYVYLAVHPLRKEAWKIEPSELDLLLGKSWIVSVHYGPLPGLIENSHLHDRIPRALGHGPDFLLYTLGFDRGCLLSIAGRN